MNFRQLTDIIYNTSSKIVDSALLLPRILPFCVPCPCLSSHSMPLRNPHEINLHYNFLLSTFWCPQLNSGIVLFYLNYFLLILYLMVESLDLVTPHKDYERLVCCLCHPHSLSFIACLFLSVNLLFFLGFSIYGLKVSQSIRYATLIILILFLNLLFRALPFYLHIFLILLKIESLLLLWILIILFVFSSKFDLLEINRWFTIHKFVHYFILILLF